MVKLEEIKFDESPNFGVRGPNAITHIVIHACDGTYQGTIATFKNRNTQVSAHYLIDRDGTVIQMVKLDMAAWHVLGYNRHAIGIEHVDRYLISGTLTRGCTADPNWMGAKQLAVSAQIVAQLMKQYNIPLNNVIGHNDQFLKQFGNTHVDPGKYWPWFNYRQMIQKALDELNVVQNPTIETPPSAPIVVQNQPVIVQTPAKLVQKGPVKINFNKGKSQ